MESCDGELREEERKGVEVREEGGLEKNAQDPPVAQASPLGRSRAASLPQVHHLLHHLDLNISNMKL